MMHTRSKMRKTIDARALAVLIRRELKLPEPETGPTFPIPFGEVPDAVPGPDLDDDPWPPRDVREEE
jgi:hypothetical protein